MSDELRALLEGIVVLGAIFMGSRVGGLGLGLWGVAGTAILVFLFGADPGSPSVDAFFIVIAVVTAASAMQAAGGIDYLVKIAAGIIQKNPRQIVYIAPLTAFAFTMAAGTGNIYFALLPIIYQLAFANGIRPSRVLAVSAVASQLAITSSPVSSAMAAFTTLLGPDWSPTKVIAIVLPASIIALLVASWVENRIGKPLDEDPEYLRRLAAGEIQPPRPISEFLKGELPPTATRSAYIFLAGVAVITVMGAVSRLRPQVADGDGGFEPLAMSPIIEMVMFTVALIIMLTCQLATDSVIKQSILRSGFISAVALFGFSWLANTFIANNEETVVQPMANFVQQYPLSFAVCLFIVAALTTSQSSATQAIVPIGLAGLGAAGVVAMWPSVIGIYAFPINGSQVATVGIDETGSTKLGKIPIWHAFTIPMLVAWIVTVLVALVISRFIG